MRTLIAAWFLLLASVVPMQAQSVSDNGRERSVSTPIKLTMAGVLVTQQIDMGLTVWLLAQSGGRYREANPLMRPFAHNPGLLAGAKSTLGVGAVYGIYRAARSEDKKTRTAALVTGIALATLTGVVAHHNYQFYQREIKGRR